ncbi:MAG: hypothetical protein WA021_00600 [Minisyncoccia bacterium]
MEVTPNPNTAQGDKKKKGVLSRRGLLKGLGSTVLGIGAITLTDAALRLHRKRDSVLRALTGQKHVTTEATENARDFLRETYGIEVQFGDARDERNFFANDLSEGETIQSLQMLIEEMGKYPSDFFVRNKLVVIRIAKNFQIGSTIAPKAVAGFARNDVRIIGLSFAWENSDFFRHAFHHEMHHVLDYWNHGEQTNDERWEQIHEGCTCVPNVRRKDFDEYKLEEYGRSFINAYGESSALEERAEFAAMMMVPRKHASFLLRLQREQEVDRLVLERKYGAMKQDYLDWSDGKMDQAYWDAIIEIGKDDIESEEQTSWYGEDEGFDEADVYEYEKLKTK